MDGAVYYCRNQQSVDRVPLHVNTSAQHALTATSFRLKCHCSSSSCCCFFFKIVALKVVTKRRDLVLEATSQESLKIKHAASFDSAKGHAKCKTISTCLDWRKVSILL